MRSHARPLENLPCPGGLAGWCICLWVCSAVAAGRGHLGYMIPFEHMSVPVRALRLGTCCVFQVSDGSEQGRAFLGSAGGRARKARSGGVGFGLLHPPQRPQGLRGLSSAFLEGQGSRNTQPDNRLILKTRWEPALTLVAGHLGVTLEGTLEGTLGCWT